VIRDEVKKGAALLDKHMPGWELKIDIPKLDMHDCFQCILGQSFIEDGAEYGLGTVFISPYGAALWKLDLLNDEEAADYGFALDGIRTNWDDSDADIDRKRAKWHQDWIDLADEWGQLIKDRLDEGVAV